MLLWVMLALIGAVAFLVLVLPYRQMPDVSKTPWHELAKGVAPGNQGAHQHDRPYFILGTNENVLAAVAELKSSLTSQGWRVYQDPNPFGGVTFDRTDDPVRVLSFTSFPGKASQNLEDYSGAKERLPEWQRQYVNIYILEMFFT